MWIKEECEANAVRSLVKCGKLLGKVDLKAFYMLDGHVWMVSPQGVYHFDDQVASETIEHLLYAIPAAH